MRAGYYLAAVAPIALLSARPVRADTDAAACIAADTEGQELRLQGRWRAAERRLRSCVGAPCPAAVSQDCSERYEDLRKEIPTVLVAARRPDGRDTIDARLVVDGVTVGSSLPSVAIEMDPGEHAFRVEHEGWTAPEQHIVLRERERDRAVVFAFTASASEMTETPPQAQPGARSGGPDPLGIALMAGGGVATAAGAVFVAWGLVDLSNLQNDSCAHTQTCSPDKVDAINRNYWIGGITGGVGLILLGVGIWELSSHRAPPVVRADVSGLTLRF